MKKYCAFFSLIFLVVSCKEASKKEVFTPISSVPSYTYKELKPLLNKDDEKTYVINFWATWCAPCVKELPAFEKINQEYKDQNVAVILVSLDFPKQVEKKLIPFINKKKLQPQVVLLDDINEDIWIKAIDKNWSGSIPATLIYNAKKRAFYEHPFYYEELEKELLTFLKL